MAATSVAQELGPPRVGRRRPGVDLGSLAWPALGAALGIAALGVAYDLKVLAAAGVAAAGGLVILRMPEVMLAVFLSAGVVKSNPLMSSVPGDLTVAAGAGVAVAIAIRVFRKGIPPLPGPAAIVPVLAAFGLLSVLWSPFPEKGLEKAALFETLAMLAFFSPFVLVRRRTELIRFFIAMVVIGLFVALTAEETGHPSNPVVAAGGNEIELAMAASIGLLGAFGYLFVVWPNFTRLVWLAPATLLATTIVKAGSRGVLIGTVLGLLFLTIWLAMAGARARRVLFVVLAVASVAVVVAGPQLAGEAADKYRSGIFSTNPAEIIRSRDYVFVQGVELFRENPLGLGLGGFEDKTNERYPHNLVLEYGSELGVLAVILFLGLYWLAWRSLSRPGVRGSPEGAVCGALLIVYGVEALVSFGPNESRPLWFVIGLCLALPHFRRDR
jgi:O-antigen ligase